nr:MAG TPA: hypothetical protein [Caudoviricetes sp.]DAQ55938.1 MAG TPA: hypothetical protein [Caudoviricetes sp.]
MNKAEIFSLQIFHFYRLLLFEGVSRTFTVLLTPFK